MFIEVELLLASLKVFDFLEEDRGQFQLHLRENSLKTRARLHEGTGRLVRCLTFEDVARCVVGPEGELRRRRSVDWRGDDRLVVVDERREGTFASNVHGGMVSESTEKCLRRCDRDESSSEGKSNETR